MPLIHATALLYLSSTEVSWGFLALPPEDMPVDFSLLTADAATARPPLKLIRLEMKLAGILGTEYRGARDRGCAGPEKGCVARAHPDR